MFLLLIDFWPSLRSLLSLLPRRTCPFPYLTYLSFRKMDRAYFFPSVIFKLFFHLCIKIPAPLNLMLHHLLATSPAISPYLCHLLASESPSPSPHLLLIYLAYILSLPQWFSKCNPRPSAISNT